MPPPPQEVTIDQAVANPISVHGGKFALTIPNSLPPVRSKETKKAVTISIIKWNITHTKMQHLERDGTAEFHLNQEINLLINK